MKRNKKLSRRQKLYVKNYLVTLNAKEAARRSGYAEKTASAVLMKNPLVLEAIDKELEKRKRRIDVTQEDVVEELAYIAFSDLLDVADGARKALFAPGKTFEDFDTATLGGTKSIREITISETKAGNKNIKIKLYDKLRALEMLGKHLGMFSDRLEVSGEVKHSNEQKYHIIQEVLQEPDVAERIRENFRSRTGDVSS